MVGLISERPSSTNRILGFIQESPGHVARCRLVFSGDVPGKIVV